MAEVTWKATFIGAFLLFLIGVVVATCLNYAYASISSIKAGLAGPYTCHFDSQNNKSLLHKTVLCNSSANVETVQSCIYIYVSYTSDDGVTTENIKLSSTYKQTIPPPTTLLGTVSIIYTLSSVAVIWADEVVIWSNRHTESQSCGKQSVIISYRF